MKDINLLTYAESQKMIAEATKEGIKSEKEFTNELKKVVKKYGYNFSEYEKFVVDNWMQFDEDIE